MTRGRPGAILEPMRTLFGTGTAAGLTDTQLLERFTSRRDNDAEAAFAALVARHGPMVRGVCRSLLADPHDAEDVFQATFLVLARKAGDDPAGRNCWATGSTGQLIERPGSQDPVCTPAQARGAGGRHGRGAGLDRSGWTASVRRYVARRPRSFTRRSPGCPRPAGQPWCSATWRAGVRRRSRTCSAAPTGPSAADWIRLGTCSERA